MWIIFKHFFFNITVGGLNNNFRNSLRKYQNNNEDIMSQSADHAAIISRLAPVYQPSPIASRRNLEKQRSTSPRSTLRKFNSAVKLNEEQVTPPGSPPSFRRSGSRDETGKNVFHRWVRFPDWLLVPEVHSGLCTKTGQVIYLAFFGQSG